MHYFTEAVTRRGHVVDTSTNASLVRHERLPSLEGDLFENAGESQTPRWEYLWIDRGGEG
ncbi:MAG: hypothetical protein FJ271_06125 [Planctomycetes bacterium]|nr:hypothetical protein [Planctomycetota bacterium]